MEIFTESQFSACYIHYRRRVRGYILSRVSDREEAEDLTQDVFENIWRCREGVRKETLHNLVYTVMRNTVIDYLRRRYMKKDKMDIYTCCEEEGRNTVEEDISTNWSFTCKTACDASRDFAHSPIYKYTRERNALTLKVLKR